MDLQSELLELLIKYVLPPIAAAVGTAVVAALGYLTVWLREKAKESKAARVGLIFSEGASGVVADIEVHMRPHVAKAMEDGRLTADEAKQLKDEAVKRLTEKLPPAAVDAAKRLFGQLFPDWISGLIERAHASLPKLTAPVDVARIPTPPETPAAKAAASP